jgi:hypothetical protein
MKTLEEKKLLVKMARAFNQPVDPLILESIEQEERFAKLLFKEQTTPVIQEAVIDHPLQMIVEANPLPPPAFVPPTTVDMIQQTVNVLNTANANTNSFKDKEIEGMRRTIAEMMQKVNTLSWGGGGTGIVRIYDADDLDRNTIQEDRVVKWQNGMFRLDTVTGIEDLTYGSFSDTTNQTANLANTAYEVRFNTTDASKEHYIRNNTEIVSNTTGTYNYAFSMQITSSSSSLHNIYIWVRKNNTDIPNTATILSLSSNKQFVVAAWNFFVDMNAGDHLHLMWAVDDTRISIVAPAATLFCPAVPSVILTVNEISKP